MAVTHGRLANIYLNGYDATGVLRKASFPFKHDIHPTPVFGKNARPKIYGLESASPKIEGWLDNATSIPQVLDDALAAASSNLVYLPDGDAFGNAGWSCVGNASEMDTASEDAPNKIMASFESNTGGERINVLRPLGALTAAVDGAALNNVVATTTQCVAVIQCHAFTGFTSLAGKIQHSEDDSVWVDLANFTAITAARSCERIVIAAGTTVQKFTRVVLTPSGTGSASVFVGFGRNPY